MITLHRVLPEKSKRDENALNRMEKKLKKYAERDEGMEFISWDRKTGTWKFRVDHF